MHSASCIEAKRVEELVRASQIQRVSDARNSYDGASIPTGPCSIKNPLPPV